MGNMSYCRFQNTLSDLKDCKWTLSEMVDNWNVKDTGEGGGDWEQSEDSFIHLAHEEKRAFEQMLEECREFVELGEALVEMEEDEKADNQ